MNLHAVLSFTAFVLWLLAFPMDGFLLGKAGVACKSVFFLAPHALSLLAISQFAKSRHFERLTKSGISLSMVLTTLFPLYPDHASWLLMITGCVAAPLTIRATAILRTAPSPLLAGAVGTAAANILLALVSHIPATPTILFLIVAAILFLPLLTPASTPEAAPLFGLTRYLPFVFVFYIISGLMYGFLLPIYSKTSHLNELELVFYVMAIAAGFIIAKKSSTVVMVLALICSMMAFALLQANSAGFAILSMYIMQLSAGFMDLFILSILLVNRNSMKAAGLGFGAVCLGILSGEIISIVVGNSVGPILAAGNIILNGAALTLFLMGKRDQRNQPPAEAGTETIELLPEPAMDDSCDLVTTLVPGGLRKRLSEKERLVLERVLQGKTFREAAEDLAITESSVKTYMRRVYEKMGVGGKEELLAKLAGLSGNI